MQSTANSNTASLQVEVGARATADEAIAGQITTITALVNGPDSTSLQSQIVQESVVRSTAVDTITGELNTLTSSISGPQGTSIQSQITQEAGTRAGADGALAVLISTLTADTTGSGSSSLQSQITTQAAAQATATQTVANTTTALQARFNTGVNPNLLVNPSFQQGASVGWGIQVGGISDYGQYGTGLVYEPSSGTQSTAYVTVANSDIFKVTPSTHYSWQSWVFSGGIGASNTYQRSTVIWIDGQGNQIGNATVMWQTDTAAFWQHVFCDSQNINGSYFTSPSNAETAYVRLDIASSSGDLVH